LAASSTTSGAPIWSTAALIAAGVVLLAMTVGLFLVKDTEKERRVYWSGLVVGAVLVAIAVLHRGCGAAIATFLAVMFIAVLYAYLRSDYLKIGGKVYNVWSMIRRDR
jgi:hypothetical protein